MTEPAWVTHKLAHRPPSLRTARTELRAALGRAGVPGGVTEDAALVLTELVGNSLRHAQPIAGGTLVVAWRITAEQVQLKVTDGGGGRAIAVNPSVPDAATSGRGLQIVERLSQDWGVSDHSGGLRSVWATLSRTATNPRGLRLLRDPDA